MSINSRSERIRIVEHGIDNGLFPEDYAVFANLAESEVYARTQPYTCEILPRQFGYWFHTGPGFSSNACETYDHKILCARNVRLLGKDGVVVYGGGWVDSTSLNYARLELSGCQFARQGSELLSAAPRRKLNGRFFLGFNAGHNNYAHWVTDQLPLLQYFQKSLVKKGVKIILPANCSAFVTYYVALLEIPAEVIEYIGDEVVEVEELIYGSFFSFDRIPKSAVELLKDIKRERVVPLGRPNRRIFISRRDTLSRMLLNEQELTDWLITEGFEVVVPGELSVEKQIALFQEAEIVIGCHGAGMANIIYCEPKTKIIELFPEYTALAMFWMLASHFDLNYGCVFGTSFDQDKALTDQAHSWDAPFVVSKSSLDRALRV